MAGDHNLYKGANYGLDSGRDGDGAISPYVSSGSIGLATDPRTANQLKMVSNQLNTGAKAVEVQLVMPQVAESIPNQHLDELNKLRKLIGADLTLHGPLVEPTGVDEQGNWEEIKRVQAERQIWSAIDRAHRVNPDGNIVVTMHASNGLPEPESRIIKDGKEFVQNIAVVNKRSGQIGQLPRAKAFHLGEKNADPYTELERLNEERWSREIGDLNVIASRGSQDLRQGLGQEEDIDEVIKKSEGKLKINGKELNEQNFLSEFYKLSKEDPQKYYNEIKGLEKDPTLRPVVNVIQNRIDHATHGESYARQAYTILRELFSQAYEVAEETDKKKLEAYKSEVGDKLEKWKEDPSKVQDFSDEVFRGVKVLSSLKKTPRVFEPLKDFAIDKAAETFSNLAVDAYKKFGDTAPIISIENPPAGSGISRAEEITALIKKAQEKFVEKIKKDKGLSDDSAKKEAEKLIGATWDVGHINMIKKYGYGDKELVEQSKKIAKYVKNIHLSDNFGMDHTELPMGMGNVPMGGHVEALRKGYEKQFEKVKKIVETGNWYQHFQTPPFAETLAAFGSPIYSMKMAPYWNQNQTQNQFGGYFSGYGQTLPEGNFSIYGAGFSGLPSELGGQAGGKSRLSGNPME